MRTFNSILLLVSICLFLPSPAYAEYLNLTTGVSSNHVISISFDQNLGYEYYMDFKQTNQGILKWSRFNTHTGDSDIDRTSFFKRYLKCSTSYDIRVKRKGRGWRHSTTMMICTGSPCPDGGYFDGANCNFGSAPNGTQAFIYDTNYYYTALSGNNCPISGSYFDGKNCFVRKIPNGVKPFIYANNWYYEAYP